MVAAIARRIVRLEDGVVTISPWSTAELKAFGAALDLPTQLEIFAGHIEGHPWDVDDPLELDAVIIADIARGWTKQIKARPPLRGQRH